MTRSVLAMVNGQPWDMHKPLQEDCELRFLHFKDNDPSLSNQVSIFSFCTFCSTVKHYYNDSGNGSLAGDRVLMLKLLLRP